jgi:hypothetical protein
MLSPTQRALIEPLRHGEPVPVRRLIVLLYGCRFDGGPEDAANAVRQIIWKARRKLAEHGIHIRTVGSGRGSHGWMVEPEHRDALAALLGNFGNGRAMQAGLASGSSTQTTGAPL